MIIAGVVALAAAVILFEFDPSHETFFPKCPLYSLTGFYCPGCGSTRCLHHLVHGHIATAFRYNPLAPILIAYLIGAGAVFLLRKAGVAIPRRSKPLAPRWIWTIYIAILLFGVLRNIPATPFQLLAPPH